jgi:hypothetical protein
MEQRHIILATLMLLTVGAPDRCYARSISIVDSEAAFPFLRSVDNPSTAMLWDSGTIVQLLSSCKLIRITRRGVRCIAAQDTLIEGWEYMFTLLSRPGKQVLCKPLNTALCVTEQGNRFFPTDNVLVSDISVTKCLNGQGRQLVPGGGTSYTNNSNHGKDDTSLCDVLDNNLDVIYDPVHNYIYTRELSKYGGLYTFISMLILIVVVLTAEAVSQRSRSQLTHNIIAWVFLTGSSLLMLLQTDGRFHPFVTMEDRAFTLISLVYIMTSTTYWVYSVSAIEPLIETAVITKDTPPKEIPSPNIPETQRDGVNAMIGSIHFATCVLYGTPDNAYVAGFFFFFLFRCMQKMYDAHHKPQKWTVCANSVLMLDVTYTSTIFVFGVLTHFANNSDTLLYAAAQYVICDTIASTCVVRAPKTQTPLHNIPPEPNAQTQPTGAIVPPAPGPVQVGLIQVTKE